MGLFQRMFRGSRRPIAYPPGLQLQIDRAMSSLRSLTVVHDRMWQIGQAAWSIDQGAGSITFTSPLGFVAVAPVQVVGSYDTRDGTWLWGWDNPSLEASLTEDARKVRSFGEELGFEVLTTPKLACPESQCWDLAALACLLAEAQGAYRGPAGAVRVFVTFGEVKLSKTP